MHVSGELQSKTGCEIGRAETMHKSGASRRTHMQKSGAFASKKDEFGPADTKHAHVSGTTAPEDHQINTLCCQKEVVRGVEDLLAAKVEPRQLHFAKMELGDVDAVGGEVLPTVGWECGLSGVFGDGVVAVRNAAKAVQKRDGNIVCGVRAVVVD
jgi:hypothetical protein